MTDYKWEIKERAEQKEIFMMYMRERNRRTNTSHAETFETLRLFRLRQKKVNINRYMLIMRTSTYLSFDCYFFFYHL